MTINKNLLCMKWDEFNSFVVNGLSNMYQRDEMADVTLFCDGRSFKAHKTILSIWSPYFKEIFAATSHPHPVIILRETAVADLELILRFIYQGQLFVPYEDADRFLKTAEHFQVAGLRSMRINHVSSQQQVPVTSAVANSATQNGTFITSVQQLHNETGGHNNHSNSTANSNSIRVNSFGTPAGGGGTQFTPIPMMNNTNSNTQGIPYRINTADVSSTLPHPSHSNGNPSYFNAHTMTESASHNQISTNVIKSHSRIISDPQTRSISPPPPSHPTQGPAIQINRNETIGKQNPERLVYQTTPQSVLIVHNPNNHNGYATLKDPAFLAGKSSETLVVLENVGPGPMTQVAGVHPVSSGSNSYSYPVYNHLGQMVSHQNNSLPGEEEILGLDNSHDNSRSNSHNSNTQIIQEAALAAGVETEHSELVVLQTVPAAMPSSSSLDQTKLGKDDPALSAVVARAPVYAVKRQAILTDESFQRRASVKPSTSGTTLKETSKLTKGKRKKTLMSNAPTTSSTQNNAQTSSQIDEFINCPKCKKTVKKTSLTVHMKRTHLEEGTVLTCPICDKQIRSKGVYYKHMYLHRQREPGNGELRKSGGSNQTVAGHSFSTKTMKL